MKNQQQTLEGKIIKQYFRNKRGKTSSDIYDLFFETSNKSYFIKTIVHKEHLSKPIINRYINQELKITGSLHDGEWDSHPNDTTPIQSRIGEYLVIHTIHFAKMDDKIQELTRLVLFIPKYIASIPSEKINHKISKEKWSKKEIMGHLVDSSLNNLKRFIDIIPTTQTYPIVSYPQDESVILNQYQQMEITDIMSLFHLLNRQILTVLSSYDDNILSKKIIYPGATEVQTIAWWIGDYVEHMKHHMMAIGKNDMFENVYSK